MKQTVYTASPESQQIHVWRLNTEGSLTLVQVVDVPGQVQPMVVSPDKRFLYVGVRPEFRVLAYRISPDDGALTYTALYLLKSYIKLRFTTADVDPAAIQVTMLSKATSSLFNAAFAFIVAPIFFNVLRKPLRRLGLYSKD